VEDELIAGRQRRVIAAVSETFPQNGVPIGTREAR
jgi:hypothetical protein